MRVLSGVRRAVRAMCCGAGAVALVSALGACGPPGSGVERPGAEREPTAGGAVPQEDPDGGATPPGWRTESFGGIEVDVPAGWGYGNLSQWCVRRHEADPDAFPPPVVERPFGATTLVACHPMLGFGLRFEVVRQPARRERPATDDLVPAGATHESVTVADVRISVIVPDKALAARVLQSARPVVGTDSFGCPPSAPFTALGAPVTESPLTDVPATRVSRVSVCRFASFSDSPATDSSPARLDAASTLTGPAARRAVRRLQDAPLGSGPDASAETCAGMPARQFVLLRLWVDPDTAVPVWVHYDGCRGHGLWDGVEARRLTAAVMGVALDDSWSGGLGGQIPWPGR